MKGIAKSRRGRRKSQPGWSFKVSSPAKHQRIKSRRAKRRAAREKKKPSVKQLLARQRKRTAVSSLFCSIGIAALLVICLMLYTIANDKLQEIPVIVAFQAAAAESNPEEPPKRARAQGGASLPKAPSAKLNRAKVIQARVSSPVSIQMPEITVPTPDFGNGDFGGGDFGDGGFGQGNGKGGYLGGMYISAKQLGVVLDASGSMTSVLPALEEEIARKFSGAPMLRVTGCSLTGGIDDRPVKEDPQNTLAAIKFLVETGEVDAIFWFCDLHDQRNDDSVLALGKYLEEKKVKLYLSSTSKEPGPKLLKIVTRFSRWE